MDHRSDHPFDTRSKEDLLNTKMSPPANVVNAQSEVEPTSPPLPTSPLPPPDEIEADSYRMEYEQHLAKETSPPPSSSLSNSSFSPSKMMTFSPPIRPSSPISRSLRREPSTQVDIQSTSNSAPMNWPTTVGVSVNSPRDSKSWAHHMLTPQLHLKQFAPSHPSLNPSLNTGSSSSPTLSRTLQTYHASSRKESDGGNGTVTHLHLTNSNPSHVNPNDYEYGATRHRRAMLVPPHQQYNTNTRGNLSPSYQLLRNMPNQATRISPPNLFQVNPSNAALSSTPPPPIQFRSPSTSLPSTTTPAESSGQIMPSSPESTALNTMVQQSSHQTASIDPIETFAFWNESAPLTSVGTHVRSRSDAATCTSSHSHPLSGTVSSTDDIVLPSLSKVSPSTTSSATSASSPLGVVTFDLASKLSSATISSTTTSVAPIEVPHSIATAKMKGKSSSSCHRCHAHKDISELYFCTNQFENGKYCKKKLCQTCMTRLYSTNGDAIDRDEFICPSCKGECHCAQCVRMSQGVTPVKRRGRKSRKAVGRPSKSATNSPVEKTDNSQTDMVKDSELISTVVGSTTGSSTNQQVGLVSSASTGSLDSGASSSHSSSASSQSSAAFGSSFYPLDSLFQLRQEIEDQLHHGSNQLKSINHHIAKATLHNHFIEQLQRSHQLRDQCMGIGSTNNSQPSSPIDSQQQRQQSYDYPYNVNQPSPVDDDQPMTGLQYPLSFSRPSSNSSHLDSSSARYSSNHHTSSSSDQTQSFWHQRHSTSQSADQHPDTINSIQSNSSFSSTNQSSMTPFNSNIDSSPSDNLDRFQHQQQSPLPQQLQQSNTSVDPFSHYLSYSPSNGSSSQISQPSQWPLASPTATNLNSAFASSSHPQLPSQSDSHLHTLPSPSSTPPQSRSRSRSRPPSRDGWAELQRLEEQQQIIHKRMNQIQQQQQQQQQQQRQHR